MNLKWKPKLSPINHSSSASTTDGTIILSYKNQRRTADRRTTIDRRQNNRPTAEQRRIGYRLTAGLTTVICICVIVIFVCVFSMREKMLEKIGKNEKEKYFCFYLKDNFAFAI